MSRPYHLLRELPPEDFQDPENFRTRYDDLDPIGAERQYQKGVETGRDASEIGISINNTWWANLKKGGVVVAPEAIGYHANTASLLRGFMNSGCRVVLDRVTEDGVKRYVLREAAQMAA